RPRRVPRQITTRPGPVPHRPARACGVAGSARTDLIPPLFPAVEVPMSAPTLDAAVHIPFATYHDSTTATLPVMTGGVVRSGVVLGAAASGKSTLLDTVAAQLPGHGIQPWRVSAREIGRAA